MKRAPLTPLAESLPSTVPFVGPEAQERGRGRAFAARIGANELNFGPSPKAIAAMEAAARDAWMYCDPESHDLRTALADHLGAGIDNVVIGEGIDGLLGYVVRLYAGPGASVVTSDGAYPTFNYHVAGFGADLIKVPYEDDKEDIDGLLKAAHQHNARLIYLANPDNPMGSTHAGARIEAMLDQMQDGCVLVLDEAYIEFADADAIPTIALDDPRVIRFRTFSKGYGLAGLRVGYAFGETETIRNFNKIRNHFGLSRVSQAGALAALKDQAWLDSIKTKVTTARARIEEIARANALTPLPSATNFVTVDCGRDADFAKRVLDALIARDVFVRMPFAHPGNRCIRLGAAPEAEMALLAEALPLALQDADRDG